MIPIAPTANTMGRSEYGAGSRLLTFNALVFTVISAFGAVAWYNVLELSLRMYLTFGRRRGLYFWALVVATWGIAVYELGLVLLFFVPNVSWGIYTTFTVFGYAAMVTFQSVVLYSRLHLVVHDPRVLRLILALILATPVLFLIPRAVTEYGANSPGTSGAWLRRFSIADDLQTAVFFLQECLLSGVYVWAALNLLRSVSRGHTAPSPMQLASPKSSNGMSGSGSASNRKPPKSKYDDGPSERKVLLNLVSINVIMVIMNLAVFAVQYTQGDDEIQAALKAMLYSIKLKMEFVVLNQLMVLANANGTGNGRMREKGSGSAALLAQASTDARSSEIRTGC
ncbi:MAG: hypothetical protein M1838_002465 [Thelocarpon superellum]|nr:MAG: hypothetical protein M1838_002465 [Thelocarpon superellum]